MGILNAQGLRDLRRRGHDTIARTCVRDLLPERVRFVDHAFVSALELATDAELRSLYASPFPARPCVTEQHGDGPESVVIGMRVPPDLCWLRGHFPELPLVPGAVQIGWALEFGAESLGTSLSMRALRSIKFERIIQPGQSLCLHIAAKSSSSTLRFEYRSESGRHSFGQIHTEPHDD